MQLPDNIASFSEALAKLPQEKIAKGISLIILIYLAYLCAQLTWQFVPDEQAKLPVSKSQKSKRIESGQQFDVDRFTELNLFGKYNEQAQELVVEEVQDAPETRLNLTLSGVVASSDAKTAAAIIENNGKQSTYGIGDKIDGTRASLAQVHVDRVIIKQSGRMETLMLDGFDYNQKAKVVKSSNRATSNASLISAKDLRPRRTTPSPVDIQSSDVVDLRDNAEISNVVTQLKQEIADDPGKIIDYLRISPKREQGKTIGYRLMPGKNPEFFKSSGLQPGDIAVQMNGLDLSSPSEAAQALQALKQEQEISLLVQRAGELTVILFSVEN